MKRLFALLTVFLAVASSCGSDNDGASALEALGFSADEASCYEDAYAEAGLDISKVFKSDVLSDEDASTRDQIASDCSGGTVDGDSDGDSDSDSDSDSDALLLDELSTIERLLVDEMMSDGVSEDGALCMISAIQNEDIDIGELLLADDEADEVMGSAMMMILFSCMEELFDSESFSFDDLSDDENFDADAYGDDPELDDLRDYCADGDLYACDELYLMSPGGSQYEDFGSSCGYTQEPTYGGCVLEATSFGDDVYLDGIYKTCADGDLYACDELYLMSPGGSQYEDFGSSCGYTQEPTYGGCVPEATSYGDDAYLNRIHDDCAEGNLYACDKLYEIAPFGSEYEDFGSSCGGLATEEQFGSCAENLGT
ncbi:MAG: hypothetical protein HOH36_00035 [Acidimicrobiaceae bacterium]|nr:hypothetical protein [Acidimicrobiaceae bacterium]